MSESRMSRFLFRLTLALTLLTPVALVNACLLYTSPSPRDS